jgi:hypothetical protein
MVEKSEEHKWLHLNLDQGSLLNLRQQLETRRIDYNDRIWETAKFFTTMFSGLASISVLLQYIPDIAKNSLLVKAGLLFVPALALSVSIIGFANLRRECSRSMQTISMVMKIDTLLKLHEMDFTPPMWKDDYEKWRKSEKDWLRDREKVNWTTFGQSKSSVLTVFSVLFIVYITISSLLLLWSLGVLFYA